MEKIISVALGDYFDEFVDSKIAEGRYKNAGEMIRAGLRLLEEEENKMLVLKKAIQVGIDSGIVNDFDSENYLENLKVGKDKNG